MSLCLGLDLGGTNIKAAVVSVEEGDTLSLGETAQWPTDADRGPGAVTERLIEAGREMIDRVGPVESVGIGVPGLFDRERGTIELFPNLPGPWKEHSLRDPVGESLGVPATLINDARAFVLAEGTMGAGKGHSTLVGITLGTGIGGGIMIDGRLHLGAFGTGGEISHQIIVPDGPPCGCGNRGCLEPLAMASTLVDLAGREDVAEIYAMARQGDEKSASAVAQVANYLGIGLANVVTLLGPSCIVVGGGISEGGELVLAPIREAMQRHITLAPAEKIAVVKAELGNWAGAIGAALAGMAQFEVLAR